MDMELEIDLRARLDEPARSFRKHVAFLADRIFIQEDSLFANRERAIGGVELAAMEASVRRLDEGRPNVVNDRETLRRNNLNAFEVTILGQFRIDEDVGPLIGRLGVNNVI